MYDFDRLEQQLAQEIKDGLTEALEKPVDRDAIKQTLMERRQEKLVERYHLLSRAERAFMEVVDVPVDWGNIQPELRWVTTDEERAIWDYARNIVSSMPEQSYVGRRLKDRKSVV